MIQSGRSMDPPRRALEVGDYLDILRRQAGWILGPLLFSLVAAVTVAFLWPDTYVSVASIRVVPPQVPENIVPANVNVDLQGRVNSLVQLILNRATLTNIIHTHGLYRRNLASAPLDDVVENMRLRDIKVTPLQQSLAQGSGGRQQYPAFEIRFAYRDRFLAQKVLTDIVARFLEENVREVSDETASTTQFLRDQWEAAKKKLDGLEQQLSLFRARNLGRLPEEQQNNYQQLAALESQRLNLNMAMNRVNQERLLTDNQLRIYRGQLESLQSPNPQESAVQRKSEKLLEKDREIALYEDQLSAAQQRYRDTHPDVQRLGSLLETARHQRDAIIQEDKGQPQAAPVPGPSDAQSARERRELAALIERAEGLTAAKDVEFEDYRKQAGQLDTAIQTYQERIAGVPVGIREYDQLVGDRDLAKRDYEDLDRRLNTSVMSTALQNRQQGERLEQLDPPTLPQTPSDPKRSLIVAAGVALGLLLGASVAAFREAKDHALKGLKDIHAFTEIPVLGNIPVLQDLTTAKRHRRKIRWVWSAAGAAGAMAMAISVAYHFATRV